MTKIEKFKKHIKNHCLICKKIMSFSKSKRKRKFCSRKCFYESRKYRVNTKCDFCKKSIIKRLNVYKKLKHHFCNRECHFKFSLKFRVNCDTCDKILYPHPYKRKRNKHYFCSRKCFHKFTSGVTMIEVTCFFCKNKFQIQKYRRKNQERFFCSRKCFYKFLAKNKSKTIICLECKKQFQVQKCILKLGKGKFCNKECFSNYHYKEFPCFFCGKKIRRRKSRLKSKRKIGRFCSRKCFGKWESKNIVGKNHHNYNKKERRCAFCKKKILVLNFAVKKNKNSFCDRKCYGRWQSKYRVGKNSPCWVNGNSYQEYPAEFSGSLKEFIRKRDQYKCQNKSCGIPQIECLQKLHIHHIDHNRKNNDSINLIALCLRCHTKANRDRKYWQAYYENIQIERKVHELEKYYLEKL